MGSIDWSERVATDFRARIIVDADSPILAFKASRDRYTRRHPKYAGLPYLGSSTSEDALTWNVFRSLQKARKLDTVCDSWSIGRLQGLLLWTVAPEPDEGSAILQYECGALIRRYDGPFGGQTTEPDIVVLGTEGVAVVECKLSEPDKPPSHLWEGSVDSVAKRRPTYLEAEPTLVPNEVGDADVAPIYQLLRMAFYALQLGKAFSRTPAVVAIGNERNWNETVRDWKRSAADLWEFFLATVSVPGLRREQTSWQRIRDSMAGQSLDQLDEYLSSHPCL